jgi:outer membrane protein assembly factor BamD (BamD/ComL family)
MATSVADPANRSTVVDPDLHPALAWLQARSRPLGIALGAVVLVGLVGWYISESGQRKEAQAADALDRARAVMETGNYPEASAELQRVTQVFGGTEAATEARLALNQARLLSGQDQLAVDDLTAFVASNPPAPQRAAGQALLGAALENVGKFAEAAQAYLAASEAATREYLQVDALLNAARAQKLAGDQQAAVATLEGIIRRYPEGSSGVIEAKVRLAELTGGRV